MKDNDDIIVTSRDLKKALTSCQQEPNMDSMEFRGTNSIQTNLKDNDDVIISRSRW